MRIAFLGTPDFAIPSLDMLHGEGHELAVFTQMDKPVGRHGKLTPPPVKAEAERLGLPVYQFEKIRSDEGVAKLLELAPDLMVTAAFGQLLSERNLSIPKHGCINVHASLLPKYRGAAPIQWAIVNGERETGVTTMLTELGLDTGDILMAERTEIGADETAGELFERLSVMGADVLKRTIRALEAGTLTRAKQNDEKSTMCRMIKKEHGHIDFSLGAKRVHDLVRGLDPWPSAYAEAEGETVKIWRTRLTDKPASGTPGLCVTADSREGLFVDAGDSLIEITELQFPGGRRMEAKAALNSRDLKGRVLI